MFDMGEMMKKAQQMQSDMKEMQKELANEVITTGAGKGAVLVTINGEMDIKMLTIDPTLAPMDDAKKLAEMVKFAVNEAIGKAKDSAGRKMGKMTGGMNIPGLSGMLGN